MDRCAFAAEAITDDAKMRILHILNRSFGCRDARDIVTLRTCDALAALGHEVILLTGRGKLDYQAVHGVSSNARLRIIQLPVMDFRLAGIRVCSNLVFFAAAASALRRLTNYGESVIYTRERHLVHMLIRRKRRRGARIVYDAHEVHSIFGPPEKSAENRRIEAAVLNSADAITAGSRALAEKIRDTYGAHLNIDVIPFAAPSVPDQMPLRSSMDGIFRVFYMGQLSKDRGTDDLIAAIKLVPGCEAHLLGGDADSALAFRGQAAETGVTGRVFFYGFVDPVEIPRVVSKADAFVIPPKAVGRMPYSAHTKVYDCLAGGRPIIASDLPSIREVLTHEVNALLVEPGSCESIAAAIMRLRSDPGLAERLGARAFEDARVYTYENRAAKLQEVFERVLA